MGKIFFILALLAVLQLYLSNGQLLECFKCTDSNECSKDRDFCDGHDRCLKISYVNGNGEKVSDARCSTSSECDSVVGKMLLCDKKKKCEITRCCPKNLCNSPGRMDKGVSSTALPEEMSSKPANGQLLECFKCTASNECSKEKDFCDGHDRCLKMNYVNGNGEKVSDARCATSNECDSVVGKMILCDKKKKCEITRCCRKNLCNSPDLMDKA